MTSENEGFFENRSGDSSLLSLGAVSYCALTTEVEGQSPLLETRSKGFSFILK